MTAAGTFALDTNTYYLASNPNGYTTNTGTVTTLSVVSANGFAGTVATASTTPALTLSTTVTGLLKGNGTAISAAVAGVDYQAPITNPVTGTGTATQVAFWSSTSALSGDSGLYWDNTNKRLGIGTTSPTSSLEVSGSIVIEGGSDNRLYLGATIGTLFSFGTAWNGVSDSMFIEYGALGTGKFVTFQGNGGKVGIGTTTPPDTLTVVKDTTSISESAFGITLRAAATGTPTQLSFGTLSTYSAIQSFQSSANWSTRPLSIQPMGGNVGIGTTAPVYKVDVQGSAITDSSVRVQGAFDINPLAAPPVIGGFTLSAGTSLGVGQYYYFVTYVTAVGETSAGGNLSVVTTSGNTTVNLTGIPVSSDPRVTARKLYRTSLNQSSDSHRFLGTISNNTQTTYTDSTPDASLTGNNLQLYKVNTTSRYITVSGTQGMVIDANLTTLGRSAGAQIIATSGSAIRTVLIGANAGQNITTGFANVIVGVAGGALTTGGNNALFGDLAGYNLSTGYTNTMLGGDGPGRFLTTGYRNTIVGGAAGRYLYNGTTQFTTGADNTIIGGNIRMLTASDTNSIVIGYDARGLGSNTVAIGNTSTILTSIPYGNVGIGTISPTSKLDVNNTTAASSSGQDTLRIGGSIDFANAGSGPKLTFYRQDNNVNLASVRAYTFGSLLTGLAFDTGYNALTTKMVIDNAGNVGIGTTTPVELLSLSGATATTLGLSIQPSGWNGAKHRLTVATSGDVSSWSFNYNGSTIDSAVYATSSIQVGQGVLTFSTGVVNTAPSEKMRITSTGNVGIGTTSPAYKLDINGGQNAFRITSNSSLDAFIKTTSVSTQAFTVYQQNSADIFRLGFTTLGLGEIKAYGNKNFHLADTIGNEWLYLKDGGNVGIGTTSPSQKLHVDGSAYITGALYDSTNSPGTAGQVLTSTATGTDWKSLSEITGVDGTGTVNYVAKWSDADTITNSIIYDNGTNVGIGTTTPAFPLTVNGSAQVIGTLFSSTIRTTNLQDSISNSNAAINFGGNSKFIQFVTDTIERIRITSTGNVGIGTTSPSTKLHIVQTSALSTRESLMKLAVSDAGNDAFYIANGTSTDNTFWPAFAGYGESTTRSGIQFIGLLPASADASDSSDRGILNFEALRTTSATDPLNGTFSGIVNRKLFTFSDINGAFINIYPSRNMSIGAAFVPSARLHVRGSGSTSATTSFRAENLSGSASMVVLDNGNVGIGTTSPSQKLHVDGSVRVTGAYYDSANSAGTSGQILSSTVTGTSWINNTVQTAVNNGKITVGSLTGTTEMAPLPVATYDGAIYHYVVKNGANLRAGTVNAVWDGTVVAYTEVSTSDIGSTSGVLLSVTISGTDAVLNVTVPASGWSIKVVPIGI
jgi:hypothetical protein